MFLKFFMRKEYPYICWIIWVRIYTSVSDCFTNCKISKIGSRLKRIVLTFHRHRLSEILCKLWLMNFTKTSIYTCNIPVVLNLFFWINTWELIFRIVLYKFKKILIKRSREQQHRNIASHWYFSPFPLSKI